MEQVLRNKPFMIYVPYAFLVTALFSFYIMFLNKVELKPYEVEYPDVAFIAPSFELPTLGGGKIKLTDYRGKVVFLNFWATWCSTCKVEMPSMQRLYDKFKAQGFEMITISVDKDQELIQPFMDEYNLTFPVLLDPDSEIAKKLYKTTGVPETFIIRQDGIIAHKAIGPRDWASDEVIQAFQQLVGFEDNA